MFEYIIKEAIEELREMVDNDKLLVDKSNNFLSFIELEDEFSHNDIETIQYEFIKQAKEYLKEKGKSEYLVYCDYCVHIVHPDVLKKYDRK